jgi:hypothetical protein
MKKILLVLLIASGAFATVQNVAKITSYTWGATDTIITSGNFSIDSSVTIGAFWRYPIAQAYTLDTIGIDSINLSNAGDAWKDSCTGTAKWPRAIKFLSNNALMKIAAASGAISATNTNLYFNGTGAQMVSNKSTVTNSLTIGSGAGLTISASVATVFNGAAPLTFVDGGSITNNSSGIGFKFSLTATGNFITVTAGSPTITNSNTDFGSSPIVLEHGNTGSGNVTGTIPEMTFAGVGAINLYDQGGGGTGIATSSLAGNISFATTTHFRIRQAYGQRFVFLTNNKSILGYPILEFGRSAAGNTLSLFLGSSTITSTSYLGTTYANGALFNLGKCAWTNIGAFTWNTNDVITDSSAGSTVTFSGVGTTTNNGKTFPGSVVINSAGVLRTIADKFRCAGNLTLTAGKVNFGKFRDTVLGDYINNLTAATDTVNKIDTMYNFGSWIRASGAHSKNDTAQTMLSGTALCNWTFGDMDFRAHMVRLTGASRAKQVKFIDNGHIRYFKDSTGTMAFNSTGMRVWFDSSLYIVDSAYLQYRDTIQTPKLLISSTAKVQNSGLLYFGLALKDTIWTQNSTANSIGNLTINKSGDTLTLSGATRLDTLQVVDGGLRMSSATDTVYTKGLSWTSTDPSTIIAPIVVTDSIYIAPGASIGYSGVGRIQTLACKLAAGGNAAKISYPPIGPVSYGTNVTWTNGTAITARTPTITGCSIIDSVIAPAYVGGISLAKATGIATGTPAVGAGGLSKAGYKVYFYSYSYGGVYKDSITDTITVNPALPVISYVTPAIDIVGLAAGPAHLGWTVTSSGGTVTSYALTSGTLVSAMSLNTSTGLISGIPATAKAVTVYRITATNVTGSSYFDWTETVVKATVSKKFNRKKYILFDK